MSDRNPEDFEHRTELNHVNLGRKEAANVPNSRTSVHVLHTPNTLGEVQSRASIIHVQWKLVAGSGAGAIGQAHPKTKLHREPVPSSEILSLRQFQ
jgi:hypothetical protein